MALANVKERETSIVPALYLKGSNVTFLPGEVVKSDEFPTKRGAS